MSGSRLTRFAAPVAGLLLTAQAPAGGAQSLLHPDFDALCKSLIGDNTDALQPCLVEEQAAHQSVLAWLDGNGLLAQDGMLDSLQLAEAQLDPLRALSETPASTASYCFENAVDWISLNECIAVFDRNPLFSGPLMGGQPDMSLSGPLGN